MPDDKFLDYYIHMSESYIKDESSYVVLSRTDELVFIKTKHPNLNVYNRDDAASYKALLSDIKESSILIFHSFQPKDYTFIKALPEQTTKVWLFWGADGYAAFPQSSVVTRKSHSLIYKPSLINYLKSPVSYLRGYFRSGANSRAREVINKMDYCATWVENDFLLAKSVNEKIKPLCFSYYAKELMNFESLKVSHLDKSKIFLGNSANNSNNHVDALLFLKKIEYKGTIYCPLSYGGTSIYKKNICDLGEKLFGEKFVALRNFMPLDEYQTIVNSCGIIWMNHKRQQAAGNLFVSFLTQKIVITDEDNPMNSTFKKWGLTFYSKEVLKNLDEVSISALSDNKKVINDRLTISANDDFFNFLKNTAQLQ
jgi:dTDP-N-acetylfucosamine:lipid II N-acetylfucosaminyltransferase